MSTVYNYMKSLNWQKSKPVLFAVLIVAAFLGGRYSSPEKLKIVTVDKVTEVRHEQTQVIQKIDVDQLLQKVQEKTRFVDRDVVRVVTIKPDGTKTETETDKSHIDTQQKTETKQEQKTVQITDIKKILDDYRQEEHSKTIVKEKTGQNWRVGVMSGYSKGAPSVLTTPSGLLFGAYAERKILGPFSAGVWANSYPGVGLQLSVGF